jgi:hypothetical protein
MYQCLFSILKWAVMVQRLVLLVIKSKLVYTVAIILVIYLLLEFYIRETQVCTGTGRFKLIGKALE